MKIIAALVIFLASAQSWAASEDRNYAFSDTDGVEKIRVFNDGRNTIIESVPGLIIRGATADGYRLIIAGTPGEIRGSLNGQPLVISRFDPSSLRATRQTQTSAKPTVTAESIEAKIKALEASLKSSETKLSGVTGIPASSPKAKPLSETWDITTADPNMRVLIDRWAKKAHWTAVWDVDMDIPLRTSPMGVPGDLKTAVRYVLSATELGELSLKPCFYTNNVVRVVRRTAKCDPSE